MQAENTAGTKNDQHDQINILADLLNTTLNSNEDGQRQASHSAFNPATRTKASQMITPELSMASWDSTIEAEAPGSIQAFQGIEDRYDPMSRWLSEEPHEVTWSELQCSLNPNYWAKEHKLK